MDIQFRVISREDAILWTAICGLGKVEDGFIVIDSGKLSMEDKQVRIFGMKKSGRVLDLEGMVITITDTCFGCSMLN